MLGALIFVLPLYPAAAQTCITFTVNNLGDDPDISPGDGNASTSNSTLITTLRAALQESQAASFGTFCIQFAPALAGQTIIIGGNFGPLPAISRNAVTILGSNQLILGTPITDPAADGFQITTGNCQISNLGIAGFPRDGIRIAGSLAYNNIIRGCVIGKFGTSFGNGGHGISLLEAASQNTIGGTAVTARNYIGGNSGYGIYLDDFDTMENTIENNIVGSNVDQSVGIPNGLGGIFVGGGASVNVFRNNMIADDGVPGTISRGIYVTGAFTQLNGFFGNFVGTNFAASANLGFDLQGVFIEEAPDNTFGAGGGDRNVITGNGSHGIQVSGIGAYWNRLSRNLIYDNGGSAISLINGGNDNIPPPLITNTSFANPGISLIAGLAGGANYGVQLFVDFGDEARIFIQDTEAFESGLFSFAVDLSPFFGYNITLLQIDVNGNTSRLTAPVQIALTLEGEGEGEREGEGEGEGEGEFEGAGGNEGQLEGESVCLAQFCAGSGEPDSDGDGLPDCFESFCLGTNPNKIDSDDDGLPDNFEHQYQFNPVAGGDAFVDEDLDGFDNLTEFQRGSDPLDSNSPYATFYISPTGADIPRSLGGGRKNTPWRTIAYAQSQVDGTLAAPVVLYLLAGDYVENVSIEPNILLTGPVQGGVVLKGRARLSNNSVLKQMSVVPSGGTSPILRILDARGEIRRVNVNGSETAGANGLLVENALPGSLVTDSRFERLNNGIVVQGPLPRIRRNIFRQLSGSGIVIQPAGKGGESPGNLGDANDPESGFNVFDTSIGGPAVANETGETIQMENNDWSQEDPQAIDAAISGPADFEPFLGSGNGLVAGALMVTVWRATNQARITNAVLNLNPSGYPPLTNNNNGVYIYASVLPNTYQLNVTAPTYTPVTQTVSIADAQTKSVIVALESAGGATIHTADQNADNRIDLSELLRVIQFFNSSGYRCQSGTEDGYAPGAGSQTCTPHASDYGPQDWIISLSEVLRLIQFFNLNGYYACEGTEDGFCPGNP